MAITALPLSASEYQVKMTLSHDSGTDTDGVTISNAALLAAMVAGPLETAFSRPGIGGALFASQAAARAALGEGSRIDIDIQPRGRVDGPSGASWGADFDIDGNGAPTIVVNTRTNRDAGFNPFAILTVEMRHSTGR